MSTEKTNTELNQSAGQDIKDTSAPLAIIRTSGKQFFLAEGMEFEVNRIEGDVGSEIQFDDVLLYSREGQVKVGTPVVAGAKVSASIVNHKRGPKLISYKKIRRRGKEWKKGHRQDLTRLKVTSITA